MKIKDYAMIDNLYSSYVEYRWQFKHIFVPNPIYGENSASKIRNDNGVIKPNKPQTFFDQSKAYIGLSKQEI